MRTGRLAASLLIAMLLAACASSYEVTRADGWKTHVVSCGGPFLNMGNCIEKAGEICRGYGYTVLDKAGGELPASPDAMPTGGWPDIPASAADLGHYHGRKLYIRCNG